MGEKQNFRGLNDRHLDTKCQGWWHIPSLLISNSMTTQGSVFQSFPELGTRSKWLAIFVHFTGEKRGAVLFCFVEICRKYSGHTKS